jgi:hypothetical protein
MSSGSSASGSESLCRRDIGDLETFFRRNWAQSAAFCRTACGGLRAKFEPRITDFTDGYPILNGWSEFFHLKMPEFT